MNDVVCHVVKIFAPFSLLFPDILHFTNLRRQGESVIVLDCLLVIELLCLNENNMKKLDSGLVGMLIHLYVKTNISLQIKLNYLL